MSTDVARPPVEQDSTGGSLRERLLAALLEDPAAMLEEHLSLFSSVRLTSGTRIVLIECSGDAAPADLRRTADAIVGETKTGTTHIVAVGGGPDAAREIAESAPFWQIHRRFGFHHVDPSGNVVRVTGAPLRLLKDAVERLPAAASLSEERIASLREQARQQREKDLEKRRHLDGLLKGLVPWATIAIGMACIVLFALGKAWADGAGPLALFRMGANSGVFVAQGEWWRLLASAFLHADTWHLFVNMTALMSFGTVLEMLLGRSRYVLLYGLSALGGGLASAFLSGGTSVGASGAIWGLMTAGVGLAIRPRGLVPPDRLAHARRAAAIPLAVNVLYSFMPGIDLFAHLGGGLVGIGLILTGAVTPRLTPLSVDPADAPSQPKRLDIGWLVAGSVVAAALATSVIVAFAVGQPWRLGQPPVLTRVAVADTGVALAVPNVIASEPVEQKQERSARVFTFGAAGDVVVVEVVVSLFPKAVPPEQVAMMLGYTGGILQHRALPGAELQGDPKIVDVRGRSFLTLNHRIDQVALQSWASIFGDRLVVLRIYAMPNRPASWAGIEDEIVESLEVESKVQPAAQK